MITKTINPAPFSHGNWQASETFFELDSTMLGHKIYLSETAFGRWFALKRFLQKLRYQLNKNHSEVMVFITLNKQKLSIEWLNDSEGNRCLVVAPVTW